LVEAFLMRISRRAVIALAVASTLVVPLSAMDTAGATPPTAAPILSSPADTSLVTANPVLSWAAVSGALIYDVQAATNAVFSPLQYEVTTSGTKATPTSDLPQSTIYWRVRGGDGATWGPFSTVFSFAKGPPPGPTPVLPVDNAALQFPSDPGVLSWTSPPGGNAQMYFIEVDDEPLFIPPLSVSANTTNTSYALTYPPVMGQLYYWRVKYRTVTGYDSQFSTVRHYSWSWGPPLSPTIPILRTPPNAFAPTIEAPDFSWDPVPGAVTYDLQASPDVNFNGALYVNGTVKSTRFSPPGALPNAAYYWRVKARNFAGATSGWSALGRFTKAWPAPSGTTEANSYVTLLKPDHQDYAVTTPTYSWTPVRRASYYEVQISTDSAFQPQFVHSCYTNHTTFTPLLNACNEVDPVPDQLYYWRVRPFDGPTGIIGIWSPMREFIYKPPASEVGGAVGTVTLLSPASGTVTNKPVLVWSPVPGATRYRVTLDSGTQVWNFETANDSYVPQGFGGATYTWNVQTIDNFGRLGPTPAPGSARTIVVQAPGSGTSPGPLILQPATSAFRAPLLTWNPVSGATYSISVAPSGSSTYNLLANGLTTPAYSYTEVMAQSGSFNARLDVVVGNVVTTGVPVPFNVSTFAATSLISPPKNCGSLECPDMYDTPSFKWSPVAGANRYVVAVAADPEYTNVLNTYVTRFTEFTPPESWSDNQAGQGRYWYAQPCIQNSCGAEASTYATAGPFNASPVGKVRKISNAVQPIGPGVPYPGLAAPPSLPNQVTFQWTPYLTTNQQPPTVNGFTPPVTTQEAHVYQVEVSTVNDFSSIIDASGSIDDTIYTPYSRTYPEGPLFWRVRAVDASGNAMTWSQIYALNKASPPPSMVAPVSAAIVNQVPAFSAVPQDYAAIYEVEVYRNPDLPLTNANLVLTQASPMATITFTGPLPRGDYGWRLRRQDVDGRAGPWTADAPAQLRRFTVQGDVVNLSTPVNGSRVPVGGPFFSWTAAASASQYRIDTSSDPGFAVLKESVATVMTAWAPTNAVYSNDETFYWQVVSLDANNNPVGTSARGTFGISGVEFHSLVPTRAVDSRPSGPAVGGYTTPWGAGVARDVTVADGGTGGVPVDAAAVALNVTITAATGGSYLTLWPAGQGQPVTSNLNWVPGDTKANAVTVKAGAGGKVSVFNAAGTVDVIVDVVGYYDRQPGDGFTGMAPVRLLDSRPSGPAVGPYTSPWAANQTRDVVVAATFGVPASATSVVLNATITNPTAGSFLTVWPSGQSRPLASNLNWGPAETKANAITVKVGAANQVSVYNQGGTVDVIFDVVGYFTAGAGALFHPLNPVRIQDSRPPPLQVGSHSTPWGIGISRDVAVANAGGVSSTAQAVLANVTVTVATAGSFLTVWPAGATRPVASSLNWGPGQTVSNAVTVKLGAAGAVSAYNSLGQVDVIMDTSGYYQ
jgi:hypothetical protein